MGTCKTRPRKCYPSLLMGAASFGVRQLVLSVAQQGFVEPSLYGAGASVADETDWVCGVGACSLAGETVNR